ncbi:MAG TPA: hypothetical protein VL371_21490 [Gemmataceae bacterium]|jgi:Spy/CpxP family protein refolding chaperone|nr:hypothetical protein [Gemmataceae bacterium]
MRSKIVWAAAVGVALAATGTALTQGRGGFGGGANLLAIPQVQEELKLTDDQKDKVRDFMEKFREKSVSAFQDAQGDFGKIGTIMAKMNAEAMKDVAAFLKADQVTRFKQLSRQRAGAQALMTDEDLQKDLKLTKEQTEKLAKLNKEMGEKQQELFQGGPGPESFQKMQEMRTEYGTKANAILTADQQKSYKDLLGKPFEFPQFGGRGGFGKGKGKDK